MQKIKKAMILAAGFGTRLKPLTETLPKALVKVKGVPMIEPVIKKLVKSGIKDIVINTHHFADLMNKFFSENNYGVNVHLIFEKELLGTGGGIKNAKKFFDEEEAFIVHNVDVDSDIDFDKMEVVHYENSPLSTLAVKYRKTNRPLIIDSRLNLIGRKSRDKFFRYRKPVGGESYPGFCGIHILSSLIFGKMTENGFFDIFTTYFRIISEGNKIMAYDINNEFWQDLGTIDKNVHSL